MGLSGRTTHFLRIFSRIAGIMYTALTVLLSFWTWDQIGITQGCCKAVVLLGVIPVSAFFAHLTAINTKKRTIWRQGNSSIILRYDNIYSIAFKKANKSKNNKRIVLISVNTHYDTVVNNRVVSATSLHGQWVGWMGEMGIPPDVLNQLIQKAAKEQGISAIRTDRKEGNTEAFPRGTIIELEYKNTRFFLLALSEFDESLNAHTGREQVIDVLKSVCAYYDKHGCGQQLFTPLIGTELSRANISEQDSLLLMKGVFQLYSEQIHNELNIVVYDRHKDQVSIFE